MSSLPDSASDSFLNADLSMADLAFFFTLSADVMCILDSNGHCLRINPAFEQLLGYSSIEMSDRTLASLAHPDDRAATQTAVDQLLLDSADSADSESSADSAIAHFPNHFTNRLVGADDHWHQLDWTIFSHELIG